MARQPAAEADLRIADTAVDLRVAIGKLRRRLREQAAPEDFTPSQLAVLQYLERNGPASVTQIALAHGVRPQSMGATVAVLEAAGCVAGAPDPADGRRTILSMTGLARDWIAANRAAKEDWLVRSIEANLSADEYEQLVVGIALLVRLAES
jgi:DNA-binding MarR family transcriptional regulator